MGPFSKGKLMEHVVRLCTYQCLECGWKGFVRARMVSQGGTLVFVGPVNPNEVCPACRNPLGDSVDQYTMRCLDDPLSPLSSCFSLAKNGPTHEENLWRWILDGDIEPDVANDSPIVQKRLQLATSGCDLFARSQEIGSVVTIEAWEPPEGKKEPLTLIVYRRDTGEIVPPDRLPPEEENKDRVREYVKMFLRSGAAVCFDD